MSPEAQRIAIAEACGFKEIYRESPEGFWAGMKGDSFSSVCVPDYLSDLNAMHEAEGKLSHEQLLGFDRRLHGEICKGDFQKVIHATAAQRAEAFLRALDLWKD